MPSFQCASTKSLLKSNNIDCEVVNLNLMFANKIGFEKYQILRRTDLGDLLFSSLLFPHMKINKEKAKDVLSEKSLGYEYDEILTEIEAVIDGLIKSMKLSKDDIVLFYIITCQVMLSLYIAKKIDKIHGSKIWFAGVNCGDDMGDSLRKVFTFIDKTFYEDVDEEMLSLLTGKKETYKNLNHLPTPDYTDYYNQLEQCKESFKKKLNEPFLLIEMSRGCYWNKCVFCTLNANTKCFRERSPELIVEDYKALIKKHKTTRFLIEHYVNPKNWRQIIDLMRNELPGLTGILTMNFKANELQSIEDWERLKSYNVDVLIGTESFSESYLKLLDKGTDLLSNIQCLKLSERSGVTLRHNMIYGLPFETEEHFEETKEVVERICHLVPPFDIEEFRLTFGSRVFMNPEKNYIEKIKFREKELNCFPKDVLKTIKPFYYDFASKLPGLKDRSSKWIELVEYWRKKYFLFEINGMQKKENLLKIREAQEVMQIIDMRNGFKQDVTTLVGLERDLYKYCDEIRTLNELYIKYKNRIKVEEFIEKMIDKKLIIVSGEKILSLAV